jgi:hypothetical protein
MSAGDRPVGWAFLVARTPIDGYRLMLGPAEPARRGLIVRHARPDAGADRATVELVHDGATTLSLTSRTHRLTTADLEPSANGSELVLDEHGRPIDVVYGFVCLGVVREPTEVDLRTARRQAFAAYRQVLGGGEAQSATPYQLTSALDEWRPVDPSDNTGRHPAAPRACRLLALGAGVVTVLVAVLIGVSLVGRTSTLVVPAAVVGTWTGTYPAGKATLTVTCGQPCALRPGDQIGGIVLAACEYPLAARAVDGSTVIARASTADPAGCPALGEVRISVADRPGAVTVESDGRLGSATLTLTRT